MSDDTDAADAGPETGRSGTGEPATPPADGHLTVDEVADLSAGLLPTEAEHAGQAHLYRCPQCRAVHSELGELTRLLASAVHISLPPDVADRVDAALARAAAERTAASISPETATAPIDSLAVARERRRGVSRGRVGAALIGIAAALGAGLVFTQAIGPMGGDDAETAGTTAADSPESAAGADTADSDASFGVGRATAGTTYTAASLLADVTSLVEAQAAAPLAGSPSAPAPGDNLDRDAAAEEASGDVDTTGCRASVAAEAGIDTEPLAVDVGTYDGQPAVVVVLALPLGGDSAGAEGDVWVVSAGCLESTAVTELDILAHVALPDVPGRP